MRARRRSVLFCLVILGVAALAPAAPAGPRADSGAGLQPMDVRMLAALEGEAGDMLGMSTSYSGGVTAVGAPGGTVGGNPQQGYVTVFWPSGELDLQNRLTAADGEAGDQLGWSTSISDGTVVAGAPGDLEGAGQLGAAYVFTHSGGVWIEQAKLTASDGAAEDAFGESVAIDGETMVVGAPYRTVDGHFGQGALYVFTRTGTVWTQRAVLTASDGAPLDLLGMSVDIDGDTIVAGAWTAGGGAGAAYVFTGSGNTWSEQARLTSSDAANDDLFGWSCAVDGDTIVVGAGLKSDTEGSAHVYVRAGTAWSEQARLVSSSGSSRDAFGCSVGVSGDLAVVGAPLYIRDDAGVRSVGAAFLFTRSGGAWTQAELLPAPEGHTVTLFGWAAAVEHNTVAVGAPGQESGDAGPCGAAFLYTPTVGPNAVVNAPAGRWQRRPAALFFRAYPSQGGAAVGATQYWPVDGHMWVDAASLRVTAQGVSRIQYRAVDVNGTPGPVRTCVVRVDSRRPRVEAGPATASGGPVTRIVYTVTDHMPGCGHALVRLVVADARGNVLRRASTLPVITNAAHTVRVRTGGLAPGVYRVALRAMDTAGNFQRGVTVTTLTVR